MKTVRRIIPVLVVLFLGYLGFSLTLPLFPPLFFEPKHGFLPLDTTAEMRRILLGILFAMYPLGQFLGAPLLGKYSDKYGRKPILLISLVAIIPAYISSALSVFYTLPWLLYVSRFFCGLLEGNIVIAQAAVSDISDDPKIKAKNFGWLVALSSSAFFFGPLISGNLADSKIIHWFHYDTPFWGAAILVFIGLLTVYFLFKETHLPDPEIQIEVKTITRSFLDGFKCKKLLPIFCVNLFVFLAMFFFLNFFSAYLVNAFSFTVSKLGQVNAYLSLFLIFAPFVFGKLSQYFSSQKILMISSFLMALSFLIFVLPRTSWALIGTLLPVGFFMAIGFAFPAILVSDSVSSQTQGQALGINTSIQVFAEAITAVIGGFLMAISNSLPILIGTVCAVIGGFLLLRIQWSKEAVP